MDEELCELCTDALMSEDRDVVVEALRILLDRLEEVESRDLIC